MKLFVVFDKQSREGVVFDDYQDAEFAATGIMTSFCAPSLGDAFRELYEDRHDIYEIDLDLDSKISYVDEE